MRYEVRVTPPARRRLDRLPESVRAAIVDTMSGPLADNPRRIGGQLTRESANLWSARRGDFRIVYAIDESERTVYVLTIAHRRDVYGPH